MAVSAAGDVNGDGFDDVIVGAYRAGALNNAKADAGESYVIFGSSAGIANVNLGTLPSSQGFRILGADVLDYSGFSVSSAGDLNGDGFDDLIVGAEYANGPGNARRYAGESYVVFGKAGGFTDVDLNTLTSSQGFRIIGGDAEDQLARSVSSAGDVNADGFDDLIVGARYGDSAGNAKLDAGEAYLLFGRASGLGDIDLSALTPDRGLAIFGAAAGDLAGRSVSAAGDVNGDGFDDVVIGAPGARPGASDESGGESYVVFGGNFAGTVTHLGNPGANTLTGTSAAETFVGGLGNDTMIGNGGADVFHGGAGNDIIGISGANFFHVDGGSGFDTLQLVGSAIALNLTAIANNKINGIEKIDLTGSGNNSLTLNISDLLDLSDTSNTLFVSGNAGDVVNSTGQGWVNGGTLVSDGHTYTNYANGLAQLLVEVGMTGNVS